MDEAPTFTADETRAMALRLRECEWTAFDLDNAAYVLEQQLDELEHLRRQLAEVRLEAVAQLWNLRNISGAIVNSWVVWRKPIGELSTRQECQERALARWELNRAAWYAIDDAITGTVRP